MHELFHIAILISTLVGAAGALLLLLWPLFLDQLPSPPTRQIVVISVGCAAILLVAEWRIVH